LRRVIGVLQAVADGRDDGAIGGGLDVRMPVECRDQALDRRVGFDRASDRHFCGGDEVDRDVEFAEHFEQSR
jgi:hypothetical protein